MPRRPSIDPRPERPRIVWVAEGPSEEAVARGVPAARPVAVPRRSRRPTGDRAWLVGAVITLLGCLLLGALLLVPG